jgi:hypothetical protein
MFDRLRNADSEAMFAVTLILLGAFCLARAVVRIVRARRSTVQVDRTLDWVRALRASLVGGALVAGGFGILSESTVLIGLALIIGGEELLETSVVVAALRDEKRRRMTAT